MLENLALALTEALQDEYKARATYRAILERFGLVRPFVNIVESEERHIRALLPLFARYGVPVPEDDWPARVDVPESLTQACQEGVQAEIENGAMYERLLAMTADYPDVQQVFRNLQRASQENHLPAFQRGAARETLGATGSPCGEQRPPAAGRFRSRDCGAFNREAMSDEVSVSGEASSHSSAGHHGRRRHRGGKCG
jgi:rubrerythrin